MLWARTLISFKLQCRDEGGLGTGGEGQGRERSYVFIRLWRIHMPLFHIIQIRLNHDQKAKVIKPGGLLAGFVNSSSRRPPKSELLDVPLGRLNDANLCSTLIIEFNIVAYPLYYQLIERTHSYGRK